MTKTVLTLMILLSIRVSAQNVQALSFGGGTTMEQHSIFLGSYSYSVLSRSFHVTAGFTALSLSEGSRVGIVQPTATNFLGITTTSLEAYQLQAGIRLGNVVFVSPNLSCNFIRGTASLGWNVSGGVFFPVIQELSLGLIYVHDEIQNLPNVYRGGQTDSVIGALRLSISQ